MDNEEFNSDSALEDDDLESQDEHDLGKKKEPENIPYWRFQQVNNQYKSLKAEIEALKTSQSKPAAAPEHIFTSAELDQYILEGKLTSTQAAEVLAKQTAARTQKEVTDAVTAQIGRTEKVRTVSAELQQYVDKIPDLQNQDSEAFRRVANEYNYFVSALNMAPDSLETQLAAVRSVYGPVSAVSANKPSKRRVETQQETHGGSGESDDDATGSKLSWQDLSAGEKAYYSDAIKSKLYKDRKEVLELISSHGNSRIRQKMGAKR